MQDLRVIGVEDGSLLVADNDGTRYRINVDEVLHANLRPRPTELPNPHKVAPKEIQAHIRSGMSAEDVAAITGVSIEHIQKYEGPVLAEREYVVQSALGVPVHTALEIDPLAQGATFGSVIGERLEDLNAVGERWASWKELGAGWIVKLAFTANQIDHDARWRFDPKKLALDPLNNEAITLSQQSESGAVLIPRLRAVHPDERPADPTRFDSGAFDLGPSSGFNLADAEAPEARNRLEPATRNTQPLPDLPAEMNQTADLLEALRRRRGERETATFAEETPAVSPTHPSTGSIRIVDIPLDMSTGGDPAGGNGTGRSVPGGNSREQQDSKRKTSPQPTVTPGKSGRKGRQSMPSWDEIVFGARPDDDLA
ncbi:MAG: hypothetical protein QOE85_2021 [Actinomycetota bacterium]|jgi:hypothetical protein|nr:hypothetical protein [Glaciihabitans sp.]MDQ1562680.1 hypothetical protein [Actinomycetota bacterium]